MENNIKLYNRADGVDGHYCVGINRGGWSEYWTGKEFGGFGKLYTSESQAQEIADLLQASLQCAELKKENEELIAENNRLKSKHDGFVKAISDLTLLIQRINDGQ